MPTPKPLESPLPISLPSFLALASLLIALVAWLVGLPRSLWSSHRARRRLRAYGPPAELALRSPTTRTRSS
jgi:hypothetical protein